jgi:hypothetical protein
MIDLTKEWSITLNDRVIYEKVEIVKKADERKSEYKATLNSLAKIVEKL